MDLRQAYKILEIPENSSMSQIQQAYRDLSIIWHPDHYTSNERLQKKASQKMKELNAARDCIVRYLKAEGGAHLNEKESKHAGSEETITVCPKCGTKNRTPSSINRAEARCGRCGSYLFHEKQNKQYEDKWEQRTLCGDGACIGGIDSNGRCSHCGKTYEEGVAAEKIRNQQQSQRKPQSYLEKAINYVSEVIHKLQSHRKRVLSTKYIGTCESCGKQCATFRGEFHENISYFLGRKERAIDAKMCFPCTAKVFGSFTGRTLFGTWWGIIGAFLGPIYIVLNTGWFIFNVFRFGIARWQLYDEKPGSEKPKTKVWNQQQNILKFISGHKKEIVYCLVAIGVFLLLLIAPNRVKKVEEVVPPSTINSQQTSVTPTQNMEVPIYNATPVEVTPTQKMEVPIELEPVNPNRLNTGAAPFRGGIRSGHSQINVDNGTDTDAIVRVVRFNNDGQQKIRNFYVRSHDKFVAKQIPPGEYVLKVAFGTDWNSDTRKFNYRKSFSKTQTFSIEETISKEQTDEGDVEHTRFSKLSITLHKVLHGNFKSSPINEEEFWQ